ncbi:hypothetical protein AB4Z48_03115 [Cupriavidus sp. 2TAF22]|uniref:hypothetical protein n=1 Tax=unclassified Cupriavidus TaxID=2640874 RepID=UPI003F90A262
MQGQTTARIAITCAKLLVVWGVFGAILGKVVLEDGFDASAGFTARGIQAGALLAALLSVGCYAMILRWRRLATNSRNTPDMKCSIQEHQELFHARATWFVWGAIALFLAVGAILGTGSMRDSKAPSQKTMGASTNEITFPPCKAAGMIADQMTVKRDQGVTKEEMRSRYQPNEIMDRKAWGLMVDMVYGHPELNPGAIERVFTSKC